MNTNGEAVHRLRGGPLDGMAVADIPEGRSEHDINGERVVVERSGGRIAVVPAEEAEDGE